jgi:cell wall-associated NlpC family hydrolase
MIKRNIYLILLLIHIDLLKAKGLKHHHHKSQYIAKIAKSMLGKRYKWGGEGPYGYDCSGFTKEVFEENGIKLPRESKEQAKVGKKVYRSQLRRGDLVFFTSKNHTTVNHVGIYLGHGKFIHASRFHHRIIISPLKEYKKYFKWGRRVT